MKEIERKVEERLILFVAQRKKDSEKDAWESVDELERGA